MGSLALDKQEEAALRAIKASTDPAGLRIMVANAKGKSKAVEAAAFRRLVSLGAEHEPGSVEHACWTMVHTVEEIRRAKGRKVWRMNHMRPKIARDGEVAALEYCALRETDGFSEVLDYDMPEMTAEAIVLRHPAAFSEAARTAARKRLEAHGFEVGESGSIAKR